MTKVKSKDVWKKEAQNNKRLLKKALVRCNLLENENNRLRDVIRSLEEELNKKTYIICG